MRHLTHLTSRNHNRMRPPHVHGEPKGGGEVPETLLFFLALVVLAGPTLPAPFAVKDGGGVAQLEKRGCNLERERDAGEGVCRVRWAWAGWNDEGGRLVVGEGWS